MNFVHCRKLFFLTVWCSRYPPSSYTADPASFLLIVVLSRPPFTAYNQKDLAEKIREGRFRRIPHRYSEELNTLLGKMLNLKVWSANLLFPELKPRPCRRGSLKPSSLSAGLPETVRGVHPPEQFVKRKCCWGAGEGPGTGQQEVCRLWLCLSEAGRSSNRLCGGAETPRAGAAEPGAGTEGARGETGK